MTKIKKKDKQKEISIKKFDRMAIMKSKIKNNINELNNKTKEKYQDDDENAEEYAENKISKISKETISNSYKLNKIGKKNFNKTKENIIKTKLKLKDIRNSIKEKRPKEKMNKDRIKKYPNRIKKTTAKLKQFDEIKPISNHITRNITGKKQRIRNVIKTTEKTINKTIKVTKKTIKSIINATRLLISALIAGGWIAIIIIIVICLIGIMCTSIFGIFFSNEKDVGTKIMSSVIKEINEEYINKIVEIQKNNEYDEYEINSSKAEWKDIISIYVAIESNGKEQADVITIDENKSNQLKEIFWRMNILEHRIEEREEEIETTDENGEIKVEKRNVRKLYIDVTSKTLEEMMEIYGLNNKQREQIAELQNSEYNSVWLYLLAGSSAGDNDIVEVAKQYIGNVGGQIFWSWYGFNSRVEWCACFVSFCANQCGYIEAGIIPRFANCQNEGVQWFKTCSLWRERDYTPRTGDIIFFDWTDSNDGKADHVGIVEKVENDTVYTIEGNTRGDMCKENHYKINSSVILGYGTPEYNKK